MLTPTQLGQKIGKKVLFIGVEARNWQVADISKAAANARALGFDTISVKRADGGIKWYQTAGHLALERQAALSVGCGYMPFTYCYGPAFGNNQIDLEVAVAKEIAGVCDGLVCMDLEVEWNGNVAAAQYLANKLHGFPGDVVLSTWADPVQQNWMGVVKALDPVVSAWGPQQYTNWLSLQEGQFSADGINTDKLFPEVDVADLFGGANNPTQVVQNIVKRNHHSVWIWEYQAAIANPTLMHTLTALIGSNAPAQAVPTPKPAPLPSPTQPTKLPAPKHTTAIQKYTYIIATGDSLSGIAAKVGVTNWFQGLYIPNRTVLEDAAHKNGQASSNNGALIYPGTTLTYIKG